jgi:hypothetical protein
VLVLEDLIDDSKVPPAGRVKPLELSAQGPPDAVRVDGDRVKERGQHSITHLLRQPIELPAGLGSRLDRVRLLRARARYRGRSNGERLPSAACLRERRIDRINSSSWRIATVSSNDSKSSRLISTAAVCPWRVTARRACSRSTRSTSSDRRALASVRGTGSI